MRLELVAKLPCSTSPFSELTLAGWKPAPRLASKPCHTGGCSRTWAAPAVLAALLGLLFLFPLPRASAAEAGVAEIGSTPPCRSRPSLAATVWSGSHRTAADRGGGDCLGPAAAARVFGGCLPPWQGDRPARY